MKNLIDRLSPLLKTKILHTQKLPGDASARSYYRIFTPDHTMVIMDRASPFSISTDPFISIQNYLKNHGVPVPEIYEVFPEYGFIALQDLGDQTLQTAYRNNPQYALQTLYPQVLDILEHIQSHCRISTGLYCPAFNIRFDRETYLYELHFFIEHFLKGYLRVDPGPQIQGALNTSFEWISSVLSEQPPVFTHRDYHSRNIMVVDRKVYIIDFQDSRLGPAQYDLASLLRDAYVVLPESFIEETLDRFLPSMETSLHSGRDSRETFLIMCIQRNLKALGTFGYQATVRSNPGYLQYMPVLIRHLAAVMKMMDLCELAGIRMLLDACADVAS
ncbi:phosphotransferase [bacterium]|nr:phosphotransferase [candidate division CSSED10-310 bacterium]